MFPYFTQSLLSFPLQGANAVPEVEGDVEALKRLISITPSFDAFLKDPSLPTSKKSEVVKAAAAKLGLHKFTNNLLDVLGETGRFDAMGDVCENFLKLAAGTRGESTAVVTTFEPLSDAQAKNIGAILAEVLGAKTPLQVEARVDASIQGGMIVEVGDKFIDLSVRTRLRVIDQAVATM